MKHLSRLQATVGLAAGTALVLAACSSTDTDAETSAEASEETMEMTTVRFTLDWTPNTNHTGLFVADELGYFEDAGIDLEILPYNSASASTLIDGGSAEFGITGEGSLLYAKAAGAGVVSAMSVLQHEVVAIAVSAERDDIESPADLDGMIYGGFGTPTEDLVNQTVITTAGGEGTFESVILGSTAYEALYAGDVDFTQSFVTWEGIEAELRGTPMKDFFPSDYGFPDQYSIVIAGSEAWIEENPEAAAAFIQALQAGYEYSAENPEEAAHILIDANSEVLTEEELVVESQKVMAESLLYDDNGEVGTQTEQMWADLGSYYYENGLLTDVDGNVLTEEPDWTTYFTDDLIG